jgi:hypothetical protein
LENCLFRDNTCLGRTPGQLKGQIEARTLMKRFFSADAIAALTFAAVPAFAQDPNNAAQMAPAAPENIRMVGLSLTYGKFKFASLGDLDWSREMVHGGLDDSGAPALLGAT